jgi:hypothetical protein
MHRFALPALDLALLEQIAVFHAVPPRVPSQMPIMRQNRPLPAGSAINPRP